MKRTPSFIVMAICLIAVVLIYLCVGCKEKTVKPNPTIESLDSLLVSVKKTGKAIDSLAASIREDRIKMEKEIKNKHK